MDKLNLQYRLGIILLAFFVLGLVAVVIQAVLLSKTMVRQEMESSSQLVNSIFSVAELRSDSPFSPEDEPAFLQELITLENLRHIDIRIQSANADYPQVNTPPRDTVGAPAWFVSMAYPDYELEIKTFRQANGDVISIYADPGDAITSIWEQLRSRIIAIFLFLLLIISVTFYFTWRWMRPVVAILEVLDTVELGDFSRRLHKFSLPEFRLVGDRINHLTTWLGASKSENERLTRKSITIQEEERRHLAQELHDSLGQAVSAIKAIAVSIAERVRQTDSTSAESARNIEDIADSAYTSVRKLMTSLRPSVLDELGLTKALQQMVEEWNMHHEDTFCRLLIEGNYDSLHDDLQINIYRIVQEALTNISKHASAENVHITLSGNEIITLLIVDNGVGFSVNEVSHNMGLTGIIDRVTLLQGEMELSSKPGKGVSIQIEFPRLDYYRRRSGDR